MTYSAPGPGRKTMVIRITDAQHEAYRIMASDQGFSGVSQFIRFTMASVAQAFPEASAVLLASHPGHGILEDDGRLLRKPGTANEYTPPRRESERDRLERERNQLASELLRLKMRVKKAARLLSSESGRTAAKVVGILEGDT